MGTTGRYLIRRIASEIYVPFRSGMEYRNEIHPVHIRKMAEHDGTRIILVRFSERKLRGKVYILVDNWQFTLCVCLMALAGIRRKHFLYLS